MAGFEFLLALKDGVTGVADSMQSALGSLEGGLSSIVQSFAGGGAASSEFSAGLDEIAPGASQAIEVIGALSSAVIGLTVAGGELAIEQSSLKNQMLSTFSAMEGGPAAGKATLDMIDNLSSALPQSRTQLAGWTKQYEALGITDLGQLQADIKATASASALMGDQGAAAFQSLQKKILDAAQTGQALKIPTKGLGSLAEAGLTVDDVAKHMGVSAQVLGSQLKAGTVNAKAFGDAMTSAITDKGAASLDTLSGSMDTIKAKFSESIGRIFEDVDVSPFTMEVKGIADIFSQTTESGRAMKAGITGLFNGIFSIASKVLPYLKAFFLQLVIVGIKFYIALKPAIAGFKALFATKGDGDGLMSTVTGVADAIGLVLEGAAEAVGWFVKMLTVGKAVMGGLSDAFGGVADIASNMVQGLINGITSGVGKVVDAAKGLAQSAMDGIKGALGIKSPSTVFMQLGAHTSTGFVQGIAAANDNVTAATASMADAASVGAAGAPAIAQSSASQGATSGGAAAQGASGSGVTGARVTFAAGSIVINGAGKDVGEITEEMISLVFERISAAQGF